MSTSSTPLLVGVGSMASSVSICSCIGIVVFIYLYSEKTVTTTSAPKSWSTSAPKPSTTFAPTTTRPTGTPTPTMAPDYKSVRFRSLKFPTLCLSNSSKKMKLTPCENADWYYYDNSTMILRQGSPTGLCVRHNGNAADVSHDSKCDTTEKEDLAINFIFDQSPRYPNNLIGSIKMADRAQCLEIPESNKDKNIQTLWCADADRQIFYSEAGTDYRGSVGSTFYEKTDYW